MERFFIIGLSKTPQISHVTRPTVCVSAIAADTGKRLQLLLATIYYLFIESLIARFISFYFNDTHAVRSVRVLRSSSSNLSIHITSPSETISQQHKASSEIQIAPRLGASEIEWMASVFQEYGRRLNKSWPWKQIRVNLLSCPKNRWSDGSPLSSTEGNKNTPRAYDRLAVIVRSA